MVLRRNLVVVACAATFFACLGRLANQQDTDAGTEAGSASGSSGSGGSSGSSGSIGSSGSSGSGGSSGSSGSGGSSSGGSSDGAVTDSASPCPPNESLFNGACQPECTTSATCASGTRCMTVQVGLALCLPYQSCSYLGSDTECAAVGAAAWRVGLESNPPDADLSDLTPYQDPDFTPDTTDAGSTFSSPNYCEGDAVFVKIPATGDVACGQPHDIVRCRTPSSNEHMCALVSGTTIDFVAP